MRYIITSRCFEKVRIIIIMIVYGVKDKTSILVTGPRNLVIFLPYDEKIKPLKNKNTFFSL